MPEVAGQVADAAPIAGDQVGSFDQDRGCQRIIALGAKLIPLRLPGSDRLPHLYEVRRAGFDRLDQPRDRSVHPR